MHGLYNEFISLVTRGNDFGTRRNWIGVRNGLIDTSGHYRLSVSRPLAILTSDFSVANVNISCPVNLQVN